MHRSGMYLIVLDVNDLERATEFWCAALNGTVDPSDENAPGVYVRIDVPGTATRLLLQRVGDDKTVKNRCHIDIATDDVLGEVNRLVDIGATRLRRFEDKPECGFWVMEDPFGNEFCVVTPEHRSVLSAMTTWDNGVAREERSTSLRLRPMTEQDEFQALEAERAMQPDNFAFLLGREPNEPWVDYVRKLDERSHGLNLAPGWVPSSFLVATVNGTIVGRTSVRYELNDYLATAGGHIGYCILPPHRRRGYATDILRQAVVIARSKGVDKVLVTCDVDNIASAGVIERCGGVFESIVPDPKEGGQKRRYWIA